jgi:Kelch motif/Galactose oxidase, central domain
MQFSIPENDAKGLTLKWSSVKPGGAKFPPRSGMACVVAPNGKAYAFGGVEDTLEDEEDVQGQLSNELHCLDINSQVWRKVELASKKEKKKKDKMETETESKPEESKVTSDDGVFTMVVGGPSKEAKASETDKSHSVDTSSPSPRMNAGMVVCKGNLYIYGGLFEQTHRQYTLSDFHSLDLHKLDAWKTLIANSYSQQDWLGSDSEDSG